MEPPSAFKPKTGFAASKLTDSIAGGRDQIPVHRVAERIVEAGAIHVDREALGRAGHRGGGEAAEQDIRLKGVALRVVDRRGGHVVENGPGQSRDAACD